MKKAKQNLHAILKSTSLLLISIAILSSITCSKEEEKEKEKDLADKSSGTFKLEDVLTALSPISSASLEGDIEMIIGKDTITSKVFNTLFPMTAVIKKVSSNQISLKVDSDKGKLPNSGSSTLMDIASINLTASSSSNKINIAITDKSELSKLQFKYIATTILGGNSSNNGLYSASSLEGKITYFSSISNVVDIDIYIRLKDNTRVKALRLYSNEL